MIKRFAATSTALAIALATGLLAAAPAEAASGLTCATVLRFSQPYARMCVSWIDDPVGGTWRATGVSILNPSGGGTTGAIYGSPVRWPDNKYVFTGAIKDGQTWSNGSDHTGNLTTKASITGINPDVTVCVYIRPNTSNQVNGPC